jgi:hypothetical protein
MTDDPVECKIHEQATTVVSLQREAPGSTLRLTKGYYNCYVSWFSPVSSNKFQKPLLFLSNLAIPFEVIQNLQLKNHYQINQE